MTALGRKLPYPACRLGELGQKSRLQLELVVALEFVGGSYLSGKF